MGKYHVVCHECPEEAVLEDCETARKRKTDHESETGHRISCQEITPGVSET